MRTSIADPVFADPVSETPINCEPARKHLDKGKFTLQFVCNKNPVIHGPKYVLSADGITRNLCDAESLARRRSESQRRRNDDQNNFSEVESRGGSAGGSKRGSTGDPS